MKRYAAILIGALLVCGVGIPSGSTQENVLSPRLTALQLELARGNGAALEQFWQELAAKGTPLIEPIKDDANHMLVTFLWQAKTPLSNILLMSKAIEQLDPSKKQMIHMANTDLWYQTHRMRKDVRTIYAFSINAPLPGEGDFKSWKQDPLNPHTFAYPRDPDDPNSQDGMASTLVLQAAPPQPYVKPRPGVASGQVERHQFTSKILGNNRRVHIYLPPGYKADGKPYGLLFRFDGYNQTITTILDNLISETAIPPIVVIMIGNPNEESRSLELTCYDPFVQFLVQELLPWVRDGYNVSSDPALIAVGGCSYGGLAAAFSAFRHPEIFGNVLSQSGSFWWKPDFLNQFNNDTEWEWLIRQFVVSPKLPVKFYLDVGIYESGYEVNTLPSLVTTNRHMRDILRLKGYQVHYAEFSGGHGFFCWQGTFSDGLISLFGTQK